MMVMVRVTIKKHLPCKLEDNNETSVAAAKPMDFEFSAITN